MAAISFRPQLLNQWHDSRERIGVSVYIQINKYLEKGMLASVGNESTGYLIHQLKDDQKCNAITLESMSLSGMIYTSLIFILNLSL